MQNSAISFSVCFDYDAARWPALKEELSANYNLLSNDNLELLTIMHYDDKAVSDLTCGKVVLLEQRTRSTVQFVLR
jgi:aspartate kinase